MPEGLPWFCPPGGYQYRQFLFHVLVDTPPVSAQRAAVWSGTQLQRTRLDAQARFFGISSCPTVLKERPDLPFLADEVEFEGALGMVVEVGSSWNGSPRIDYMGSNFPIGYTGQDSQR